MRRERIKVITCFEQLDVPFQISVEKLISNETGYIIR